MTDNTQYCATSHWTKAYMDINMAYPAENVIRILKGAYPRLNLDKKDFIGKKFLDVGCGDGRNLLLAKQCGFDIYGVEISPEIKQKAIDNLNKAGVMNIELKVGSNQSIPFQDGYFDYLLSWNSSYYMGDSIDFNDYVKEFARVLKRDGYLILSIPMKSCFIFKNSEEIRKGYRIIKNDPFNVRNGEVFRAFEDEKDIQESFAEYFHHFVFGSVYDDCFGYEYHWYLAVCRRK
jgi:ubiquinone/menaquinone biosynthesis C-methylase UbiE